MTRLIGGSARSRARAWGKLIRWTTTPEGSAELRRKPDGTLTLIRLGDGTVEYTTDLRLSEAAMATVGWHK